MLDGTFDRRCGSRPIAEMFPVGYQELLMLTFLPNVAEERQLPLVEDDRNQSPIKGATEALKRLRFTIVTTGQVEADSRIRLTERVKLRSELAELRAWYLDQVDEIAMQFGVAGALKIKKQVEKDIDESEKIRRGKGL